MTIEEILSRNASFRYQLLDRMKCDCHYYLNTSAYAKHLWAKNEYEQIEYMKAIWNSFPADEKPEWLTMEEIEKLEAEMTPWLGDTPTEKLEAIELYFAGELFFVYKGKRMHPERIWFSCQIAGRTMGGEAYAHYDNALRRVYIAYINNVEQYTVQAYRNVTCDYKYGYLSGFRRE